MATTDNDEEEEKNDDDEEGEKESTGRRGAQHWMMCTGKVKKTCCTRRIFTVTHY